METSYEWDIETEDEFGDIFEHHFSDTLAELPANEIQTRLQWDDAAKASLVLVRRQYASDGNLLTEGRAYVTDAGQLPSHFDHGIKVPYRFHKEFDKHWERISEDGKA